MKENTILTTICFTPSKEDVLGHVIRLWVKGKVLINSG